MTGPRRFLPTLLVAAGGLSLLLPVAGCSPFTFVPVKGKITLKNKQPLTYGSVVFFPDKENQLRQIPRAVIKPDGTYELNTEGRSGAAIGSYSVVVRVPARRNKDKDPLPIPYSGKYLDSADSPLKVEVVANPAPGAYDFVLD
jgi:hypothetical protein